MSPTLKIAIVAHGRFHAFDLTRGLLNRGHDVTLFTSYPKWAAERFGVPRDRVRSLWPHEALSRGLSFLRGKAPRLYPEAWLHRIFGCWASDELQKESWDVVHCWSGISEEILRRLEPSGTLNLLMRGSAHIQIQARLLEEEEKRTGRRLDRPSSWMIEREKREYALASHIAVLSHFAYQTFLEEGIPSEKIEILPLGVEVQAFRPPPQTVEARCQRILTGEPLRILYVGTLSFQKGLWDMAALVKESGNRRFHFRLIGAEAPEAKKLLAGLRGLADFIPRLPQDQLPHQYGWGDIFLFPTIQDGYGMVLAQAQASALPILATTNCAGPDVIQEGKTGWVLPIRNPQAFVTLLEWCDAHRKELASMVRRIYEDFHPRDWSDVAADFERICLEGLEKKRLGRPEGERK